MIAFAIAAALGLAMIFFAISRRSPRQFQNRRGAVGLEYRLEPCERDFGSSGLGLVLHRLTGQRLMWQEFEGPGDVQIVRLHGERFHRDISDRSFAPGNSVCLVREPTNTHDANAIAVWNGSRRKLGGYIPREVAIEMAKEMDAGTLPFACWSMWQILEGRQRVDLRILIDWAGVVAPPP